MNPRRWVAVAVILSGALYLYTHLDKPEVSPLQQAGAFR